MLTGTDFQAGATVLISDVPAGGVVFIGPTEIDITVPALPPGTLDDVLVTNPAGASGLRRPATTSILSAGWLSDFLDVQGTDIFHGDVEKIFRHGITAGCGGGNYCRDAGVRRDQMAVFLLKARHGASFQPPPCAGIFDDTPCPGPFTDWVEELYTEGITGGCGGVSYCPASIVRRDQMAAFLLKAQHGSGYSPPACTGLFLDVPCPGPFTAWIEQLFIEGITGGCGASRYCPASPNTRGQMAVFLSRTFALDLPTETSRSRAR